MTKYYGEDWPRVEYAASLYKDSFDLLRGHRKLAADAIDPQDGLRDFDLPPLSFQSWAFGQRPCHPFYVWAEALGKAIPSYILPFLKKDGGINDAGRPHYPPAHLLLEVCRDIGVHPANLDPEYLDPIARGFLPLDTHLVEALALMANDDAYPPVDRTLALDVLAEEETFCQQLIKQQADMLIVMSMADLWVEDRQAGVYSDGMTRAFKMAPELRTMFAFATQMPDLPLQTRIAACRMDMQKYEVIYRTMINESKADLEQGGERIQSLGKALFGNNASRAYMKILNAVRADQSGSLEKYCEGLRYILASSPEQIAPMRKTVDIEAGKLGYLNPYDIQKAYVDCLEQILLSYMQKNQLQARAKILDGVSRSMDKVLEALREDKDSGAIRGYIQQAYENLKHINPQTPAAIINAYGGGAAFVSNEP